MSLTIISWLYLTLISILNPYEINIQNGDIFILAWKNGRELWKVWIWFRGILKLAGILKRRNMNNTILPMLIYGSGMCIRNRTQQWRVCTVEISYMRGACGWARWDGESIKGIQKRSGMDFMASQESLALNPRECQETTMRCSWDDRAYY